MTALYLRAGISDDVQTQAITAKQDQQHVFLNKVTAVLVAIIDKTLE